MNTQFNLLLRRAISQATATLQQFSQKPDFLEQLQVAFGDAFDINIALGVGKLFQSGDFSLVPEIQVLAGGELGTANGAFAASLDKIFVSSNFLAQNQANVNVIAELLLEEIGHKLDRLLNGNVDSLGDEGAIFRLLATGHTLSANSLVGLQTTEDRSIITVNGQSVSVEQQDFTGTSGNDTITGTSGSDNILGLDGDDTINPESGSDTIDGGDGIDLLEIYNEFDTDNTIITYTDINNGMITGGSNNGATFKNIERVTFHTGSGNDNINISAVTNDNNFVSTGGGSDTIYGSAHNDRINAGSSTDYIYGEGGSDTIDGGEGIDFLLIGNDIDTDNVSIIYTDSNNGTISGGSSDGTTFKNIEMVNFNTGSGDDYINILAVTSDFNIIYTNEGNDTIIGSFYEDQITAGSGSNTIDGSMGIDLLVTDNHDDVDNILITYTDVDNGIITGGSSNLTTFKNIERIDFATGSGDDYVNISAVTSNGNVIYSGAGNDTIVGSAYSDRIDGGTGSDTIDGGEGIDYFYISNDIDTDNISIIYTDINNGTIIGGSNNGTTFKNVESFDLQTDSGNDNINISAATVNGNQIYSGAGNDTINGSNQADYINGQSGNDTISDGGGNDRIYGDNGDDRIYIDSGIGIEVIDGGIGNDYLDISNDGDTDNVTIAYTDINGTISGGSKNGTVFTNIESVSFTTGSGNDSINISAATNNGNYINTIDGNDNIVGSAFNDVIYTATGDDIINGGTGSDTIDGGNGNDYLIIDNLSDINATTITYANVNNGTIVGGLNNGTIFQNIDRVNFKTGSGNDNINISAATSDGNYINGNGGNDTIAGSAHNDNIDAGAGNDILIGVNASSSNPGFSQVDTLTGGMGIDRFILGDIANVYYDDLNITTSGTNDYATITDFNPSEDIVQLKGVASHYRLEISAANTNLYLDKPGGEPDELIAVFQNVTGLSLTSSVFTYVAPTTPGLTLIGNNLSNTLVGVTIRSVVVVVTIASLLAVVFSLGRLPIRFG